MGKVLIMGVIALVAILGAVTYLGAAGTAIMYALGANDSQRKRRNITIVICKCQSITQSRFKEVEAWQK